MTEAAVSPRQSLEPPEEEGRETPSRLALVLGGGGSKGALQVGLYRAMSELGVRPDLIVGSSVGAVNGAFIAAGTPPEALARGWSALSRGRLFDYNWSLLWKGLSASSIFSARPLRTLLEDRLPKRRFSELEIPLAVVTTHLSTGEPCIWRRGELTEALLASTAVPGLLPPVEGEDGILHIDGSLGDNLPIEAARRLGATRVVAMSCRTCDQCRRESAHLPDVLGQAFSIAADCRLRHMTDDYREAEDLLLLQPDLGEHIDALDFSHGRRLVSAGYDCCAEPLRRWVRTSGYQAVVDARHGRMDRERRAG